MVKQENLEKPIELIENEEKRRLNEFVKQVLLDLPPFKEAKLKIFGQQIMWVNPKSRGWKKLKHDEKRSLMNKMKNFVKFKGNHGLFKGNPEAILSCLNECKKVVSDF